MNMNISSTNISSTSTNSTNTAISSRAENLLNVILQKWPDSRLLKRIQEGELKRSWKFDIQDSDWDHLIDQGLTWQHIKHFVQTKGGNPIMFGSICLSAGIKRFDILHDRLVIDSIEFTRVLNHRTDTEIKRAFRGIGRLLANQQYETCKVCVNSIFVECLIEHNIQIREIRFYFHKINSRMVTKSLNHQGWDSFVFESCSFADEGRAFCEALASRTVPIRSLSLLYTNISPSILAPTFYATSCVRKLVLKYFRLRSNWDILIIAIAEMKNLKSFVLDQFGASHQEWLQWLLLLMSSTHLTNIKYSIGIHFAESKLSDDLKKRNTERIFSALKENTNILDMWLHRSNIHEPLWKKQIKPFLTNRQASRLARMFENKSTDDAAALFGGIVAGRQHKAFNASKLFAVMLKCNETVASLWDSGREKRKAKLDVMFRKMTERKRFRKEGTECFLWAIWKQRKI